MAVGRKTFRAWGLAALVVATGVVIVHGERGGFSDTIRRLRFLHMGAVAPEEPAGRSAVAAPTEALAGFDNITNGFDIQGPPFDSLDDETVVPLRSFNDNRFIFEEVEREADGLGPTFNAQSCRECHQNVVTGSSSQVAELRTGFLKDGQFFESLGGSLIHSRATYPDIVERVSPRDQVRTFRLSTSTLGAGYVESISNAALLRIRDSQPLWARGVAVVVPILETDNATRIGRFGWKGQHASLESFAADAYLNEMGITSPILPEENTSSGRDVAAYDHVADPEDDGDDLKAFANFMRSTKAPPRGDITPAAVAGERVFQRAGCATCHVDSITTARPGTVVNGGALTVPAALGNKVIHPYSDYLLHDIGTGDGIPVLSTPEYEHTANLIRTAPLWGVRTRNRLMHDGLSFSREDAINRHEGQALRSKRAFQGMTPAERSQLVAFLDSL